MKEHSFYICIIPEWLSLQPFTNLPWPGPIPPNSSPLETQTCLPLVLATYSSGTHTSRSHSPISQSILERQGGEQDSILGFTIFPHNTQSLEPMEVFGSGSVGMDCSSFWSLKLLLFLFFPWHSKLNPVCRNFLNLVFWSGKLFCKAKTWTWFVTRLYQLSWQSLQSDSNPRVSGSKCFLL